MQKQDLKNLACKFRTILIAPNDSKDFYLFHSNTTRIHINAKLEIYVNSC